ncbi:hypothetical protein Pelo_16455 [Pelomyxa schiedti]|nr:hypothetical protein Pelo_16455 [Pelomyxa schiedti]
MLLGDDDNEEGASQHNDGAQDLHAQQTTTTTTTSAAAASPKLATPTSTTTTTTSSASVSAVTISNNIESPKELDAGSLNSSEQVNTDSHVAVPAIAAGTASTTSDGSAMLITVTINSEARGAIDSDNDGELGKCGRTLAHVIWEYDSVHKYRVWLKIKSPYVDFHGEQMATKVTSNLYTKAGKPVKLQKTQFRFSRFSWIGVFHVTHLTTLPHVMTFHVELWNEEQDD